MCFNFMIIYQKYLTINLMRKPKKIIKKEKRKRKTQIKKLLIKLFIQLKIYLQTQLLIFPNLQNYQMILFKILVMI